MPLCVGENSSVSPHSVEIIGELHFWERHYPRRWGSRGYKTQRSGSTKTTYRPTFNSTRQTGHKLDVEI